MSTQLTMCSQDSDLALARESLRLALKQVRKRKIDAEYVEAANDPLFMQDLEDCMRDWAELDRDSLRFLEPWEEAEEL